MLTPMDIHDHQFKKSFRGYNENEVDDFLDKIVDDYEKILRDNDQLRNRLDASEREVDQYRKLEKTMNETLMVAQRTADEVITSAKKNADEMKENTARECQTIREQARFEAKQQIDNAIMKRDAIMAEYNKVLREKNAFLLKIRTTLEAELSITLQTINGLPRPEENLPAPDAKSPATVEEIFKSAGKEPEKVSLDKEPPAEVAAEVSDGTKTYELVKQNLDGEVEQ